MPLSLIDVRHIALLARLELTPEEEAAFSAQLDHILEYFQKLAQVATDQVAPTAHVIKMGGAFRDDFVLNRGAVEPLLANAPARDRQYFKVPKIIE
jgi:aspartyl-tRNA(Asn)/glutamyl-tRNA(Gln) amidotransferase subunit C